MVCLFLIFRQDKKEDIDPGMISENKVTDFDLK